MPVRQKLPAMLNPPAISSGPLGGTTEIPTINKDRDAILRGGNTSFFAKRRNNAPAFLKHLKAPSCISGELGEPTSSEDENIELVVSKSLPSLQLPSLVTLQDVEKVTKKSKKRQKTRSCGSDVTEKVKLSGWFSPREAARQKMNNMRRFLEPSYSASDSLESMYADADDSLLLYNTSWFSSSSPAVCCSDPAPALAEETDQSAEVVRKTVRFSSRHRKVRFSLPEEKEVGSFFCCEKKTSLSLKEISFLDKRFHYCV